MELDLGKAEISIDIKDESEARPTSEHHRNDGVERR
jgi:hypothetical protein